MSVNAKTLTLAEALQKARAQEPLQGYQVDFSHQKVEALEAMQLAKAGVEVPEDRIYYDDDATVEDEAFEGNWVPVATDGLAEAEAEATLNVRLQLKPEIKDWLEQQPIPASQLFEQLLVNFYRAERLLREGDE
jgi:predicted XRE-type DNA-binding protein